MEKELIPNHGTALLYPSQSGVVLLSRNGDVSHRSQAIVLCQYGVSHPGDLGQKIKGNSVSFQSGGNIKYGSNT
jgi:hypothetical protein